MKKYLLGFLFAVACALSARAEINENTVTINWVGVPNLTEAGLFGTVFVHIEYYTHEGTYVSQTYGFPPAGNSTQTLYFNYDDEDPDPVTGLLIRLTGVPHVKLGASIIYDAAGPDPEVGLILLETDVITNAQRNFTLSIGGVSLLPDGRKPVWQIDDSTLTGNLFREGIDQVVAAVGSAGGGGGGTGGEVTLDSGTKIEQLAQKGLDAREAAQEAMTEATEQSNEAVDAMETALNEAMVREGANVSVTDHSVDAGFWVIHLPNGHGGFTDIDLNPLSNGGVSEIAQWFKIAVSIVIIWFFENWCWKEFQSLSYNALQLTQAKGNAVAAGTGAQATALINAGLIALVWTSLPAILFTAYQASMTALGESFAGFGTVGNIMPSGQSAPMTAAFALVQAFLPVTLACIVAGQVFIVRKFGVVVYYSAAVAIKFFIG